MSTRIERMDALAFLGTFDDHSIDLVCTDPAYDSLTRHRKIGKTTRLGGKAAKKSGDITDGFFPTISNAYYFPLCAEIRRVLAKHGTVILFGDDITTGHTVLPALKFAGFPVTGSGAKTYQRQIIWNKGRLGMGGGRRLCHEQILIQQWGRPWAWKTNPDHDGGFPSIVDCPPVPRASTRYPTEKPVPLLDKLVRQFSRPGDLVVDPFLGAGSIGVAALANRRRFAGCDISAEAVGITRERLAALGAS